MQNNPYDEWKEYVARERALLVPILRERGFELDEEQPHIGGERYLMQAVTTKSGKKLILLGTEMRTGERVAIKATREAAGKEELRHERICRLAINSLPFAYEPFLGPEERYFGERSGFLISVQRYIAQESSFLERPIKDQFRYALDAFKAQEGSHAATYEQVRGIRHTLGVQHSQDYLHQAREFVRTIQNAAQESHPHLADLGLLLTEAIQGGERRIEQYANFLTHTDFVPHNFRIQDEQLYLLDYSSFRFGNKHEGWARFLNFMLLHNPELEQAFLKYFADNRAPEEQESLRVMRIYRLGEIICYYLQTLPRSVDTLLTLNNARVDFWAAALRAQLTKSDLPLEVREHYKQVRDSLRSEEEKKRQKDLN